MPTDPTSEGKVFEIRVTRARRAISCAPRKATDATLLAEPMSGQTIATCIRATLTDVTKVGQALQGTTTGLVTTIIPVYNRASMLVEAVESVLAQTYRPIEVLIVDDGSTDDTSGVAARLARTHPEIRVFTTPNRGPGSAREAGRLQTRGEFIQHLDSDDLLDARKFELQVSALRDRPECGVAYCKERNVNINDIPSDSSLVQYSKTPVEMMFPAMLRERFWWTAAPLYRASIVHEAGGWLPLRAEEDWEFDCRIAALRVRTCFVDEWLCTHRRHASNTSGKFDRQTLRDRAVAHTEILKHARTFGITDDAPEMQHFARELFLLARQCGQVGLPEESERLFDLARDASGQDRNRAQLVAYALIARLLGWTAAGKISAMIDRLR
jgi:hypothetical protein